MNKIIALILAIFSYLKSFGKKYIYLCGKNNICNISKKGKYKNCRIALVGENNILKIAQNANCKNMNIRAKGFNNEIVIGENFVNNGLIKIRILGSNNKIYIGNDVCIVEELVIYNHDNGNSSLVKIGDKTSFYTTSLTTYENESQIIIGKDCMFAHDTTVYNTDGHTIFYNGKLANRAKDTIIGNHCWIAANSTILKNSHIPSGCIVGRNALVCGKFAQENAVLGGIPAKVIKSDIQWDRRTVNQVLNEESKNNPLE